jgi:hypothetical protein
MLCDANCCSAQKIIAPGRTISANNIDLRFWPPRGGCQIVKQIEYATVQLHHIACAVIPQKFIQLIDGGRNVVVSHTINYIDAFIGMRVEKS